MATLAREIQLGYGLRAKLSGVVSHILCHGYIIERDVYQFSFETQGITDRRRHTYSLPKPALSTPITENFIHATAQAIISQIKQDRGLT